MGSWEWNFKQDKFLYLNFCILVTFYLNYGIDWGLTVIFPVNAGTLQKGHKCEIMIKQNSFNNEKMWKCNGDVLL